MSDYYSEKLSGERLRRCYELASPRVRRYLEAELRHVLGRISGRDRVLELGCGYGRVALRLADVAREIVGVDTSKESLDLARRLACGRANCSFQLMDATALDFGEGEFDVVVCIQNGICAFGVDPERLLREALRVTGAFGRAIFSTYSPRFWEERLRWFETQSREGLLGPLDRESCRDGVIVCADGFRAGALSEKELRRLCASVGADAVITEVDGSSLFCEARRR